MPGRSNRGKPMLATSDLSESVPGQPYVTAPVREKDLERAEDRHPEDGEERRPDPGAIDIHAIGGPELFDQLITAGDEVCTHLGPV